MKTYAYIDASNIIYGTRDEGWKVDFKKLYEYLTKRYECKKVFYFAGTEKGNVEQEKFYKVLGTFGYTLVLKPVKLFRQEDGTAIRKANCDVDLTFYAMRDFGLYDRVIFLSGDGDFEVLLRYFVEKKKKVIVSANARRTAHEIKKLKGIRFDDFKVLKPTIELKSKNNKIKLKNK